MAVLASMLQFLALIFKTVLGQCFLFTKNTCKISFSQYMQNIMRLHPNILSNGIYVISGLDISGRCQVQSTNKVPIGLLLQSILDANNIAPISWRAKQARRKSPTKSDIDERLARHYFCPRQPSLPRNVDQYGKYGSYTTVMQGAKYVCS